MARCSRCVLRAFATPYAQFWDDANHCYGAGLLLDLEAGAQIHLYRPLLSLPRLPPTGQQPRKGHSSPVSPSGRASFLHCVRHRVHPLWLRQQGRIWPLIMDSRSRRLDRNPRDPAKHGHSHSPPRTASILLRPGTLAASGWS